MQFAIAELKLPRAFAVQPSLLLGPRKELRIGERLAMLLLTPLSGLLIGGLKQYRPIQASEVACNMIRLANNDPLHSAMAYSKL